MAERLYRSESNRVLGGVCGGIAEVYDLDPALVRIIAVLLVLGFGSGLLAYLLAWLIIPSESEVKGSGEKEEVDLTEDDEEEPEE